jgi:hypothetical protein
MSRYAEGTSVNSSASRVEIERTLTRYGATSFAYGWQDGQAAIGFVADGKQIRFVLPLPSRDERRFTHTPAKGTRRSPQQAEAAYEQAVRQSWRALALVIKAKLEAVAAGIVTFEEEFFAHIVLPSGETVFEQAAPAVEHALLTGQVKPLLELY